MRVHWRSKFVVSLIAIVVTGVPSAQGEVIIQTPYVTVIAGKPADPGATAVRVQVAPWLDLQIRPGVRATRVPVTSSPLREIPVPSESPPLANIPMQERAVTLAEFSRSFVPAKGFYEVLFIHPDTGKAAYTHFTLPKGEPRKVRVSRRRIHFDYASSQVQIIFEPRGGVRVDYR
jgi:hypothetical protein